MLPFRKLWFGVEREEERASQRLGKERVRRSPVSSSEKGEQPTVAKQRIFSRECQTEK